MKANHLNVAVKFIVVIVSHCAAEDVHFCTGSEQDGTSDEVRVEIIFQIRKTIKHLGSTLIVAYVNYLVGVFDEGLRDWLVNSVLDVANHCRKIIGS